MVPILVIGDLVLPFPDDLILVYLNTVANDLVGDSDTFDPSCRKDRLTVGPTKNVTLHSGTSDAADDEDDHTEEDEE